MPRHNHNWGAPWPLAALLVSMLVSAQGIDHSPPLGNFTLVIMWNFPIATDRSNFIEALHRRFFLKVVHIGGDHECNRWNGGPEALRIEHYTCYGKLMGEHPDAFGTEGFLFLADDAVVCPLGMLALLSADPGVPRLAHDTIRGPINLDGAVPPAVRLDDVHEPPGDHPQVKGKTGPNSVQECQTGPKCTNTNSRMTWSANGTGCLGRLEENCWGRWWWSHLFPYVKDRLYDDATILTADMKRRIAARLGDKCPAGTVSCMPAPALSDVLYVPAGPSAVAFAQHAAAITKLHLTTEIATPIIMHLLPEPPQQFPTPERFFGLTGGDRASAIRLLDPASTQSAEYGNTSWGLAGSKWDPKFKIPELDEHGCSFVWLHPLKLSYETNQKALSRFLNGQHERMVHRARP